MRGRKLNRHFGVRAKAEGWKMTSVHACRVACTPRGASITLATCPSFSVPSVQLTCLFLEHRVTLALCD
jgi:hypothetical protein